MVITFLEENMFAGLPEDEKAKRAKSVFSGLEKFSDEGHAKHIHFDELKEMGLIVKSIEKDCDKTVQDLILTVHHCFMFSLSNSPAFKIIENHMGRRMVKLLQMVQGSPMQIQFPQEIMDQIIKEQNEEKARIAASE